MICHTQNSTPSAKPTSHASSQYPEADVRSHERARSEFTG